MKKKNNIYTKENYEYYSNKNYDIINNCVMDKIFFFMLIDNIESEKKYKKYEEQLKINYEKIK